MYVLKQFLLYLLTFSFLVITLIPQNVTAADIIDTFQDLLQKKTSTLNVIDSLPEQNGRVFETNIDRNEIPNVILVYDVHCQPAVQKNIYSVINYFSSAFDIDKIFIEGSPEGKLNLSGIKNISSDKNVKEQIFKNMFDKGLLSGTELYCYLSNKDNLYGLEDYGLYVKAAKQYAELLKHQKKFSKIISKTEDKLKYTKSYIYNKDMQFFDDMFFGEQNINGETFNKIFSFVQTKGINLLEDYPYTYKYLKIKAYDAERNEKSYIKDFKNLLNIARIKLPASIYVKFLDKFKENNNNGIEQNIVYLYNSTKQFLSDKQLQEFNYIEKLQEKLSLLKGFNVKNFLKEKDALYNNLSGKIFKTDFTKDIISFTEYLNLLKKYVSLKADSDNFKTLFDNIQNIQTILSKKSLVSNERDITDILNNKELKSYYENNLTRNKIFVKNIADNAKKGTVNIAVIGGFHKEIENLFTENNIKYISVLPNTYDAADYKTYNKVITNFAHFYNALADTSLAALISEQGLNEENLKIREFLIDWIQELKNAGLKDREIILAVNSWAKTYIRTQIKKPEESSDEEEITEEIEEVNEEIIVEVSEEVEEVKEVKEEPDVTNFVLKQNKFSVKGWLLKIGDFFKNFKSIFAFKYVKEEGDRDIDLDQKDIKKIEKNIRHFPIMQIMLAAELFESFAMVFMQSSGFTLPFISSVIAILPIVSFVISGLGTVSGDKIPKKLLIAVSLIIHTIGTVSFALAGFTGFPILLIVAQVFPTIGVAALGLTLKPFLYEQLESLGKEKDFAQIYGTNRSLFWFIMSISSLMGSALAAIVGQTAVVGIAAIPDIIISSLTVITFLSTRNLKFNDRASKIVEKDKAKKEVKQKKTLKQRTQEFFAPVTELTKNKKAFSYAAINVIVNNIFIVVLSFFFQPSLEATGLNIGFFGAIYFAADMMHSISANLFSNVRFVVEQKIVRNVIFAALAALFALFVVTGHPVALILIFIAINFWQGVAELSEDTAVYETLSSDNQVRWNAFRTMFGTIIGFVSQMAITGLLLFNIPNNLIIAGSLVVLTTGSFIISQIFDGKNNKQNKENEDRIENIPFEVNINGMRDLLAAA